MTVVNKAAQRAGKIVVGVDGSAPSKAALGWAIRQAELTGGSVEAVIAWEYPLAVGGFGFGPLPAMMLNFDEIAAKTMADSIAEIVDPQTNVRLSTAVTEGHPAGVLLKAAERADLLVVGSRGHGGFAGALLGSVSQHCAHHARCPLVIIRGQAA